jgi:hypothetical protein
MKVFLKGFIAIGILYGFLCLIRVAPFLGIFCAVCLLTIPLALVQSYRTSINSAIKAMVFQGGIISSFLGKRFLKNIIYCIAAFIFAFSLLLNAASLSTREWLYILLSWPIFLLIFAAFKRVIKKEVSDWLITPYALLGALRVAPFVMIFFYFLALWYGGDIVVFLTAKEAEASQIIPFKATNSFFLNRLSQIIVILESYRNYAFGAIFKLNPIAWFILTMVVSWTFFYGLCSLYAYLSIPRDDIKRAWAKPLRDGKIDPPSFKRALIQVGVPFLAVFTALFCLSVRVELLSMMSREAFAQELCEQTRNFRVKIGNEIFNGEIIEAAIKHRNEFAKLTKENEEKLIREINSIFDGYKNNVENYLDWYYSLQGDYARIGVMVVGEAENFMSDTLTVILAKDVNQERVTATLKELNQILDREKEAFEEIKSRYRYPCGLDDHLSCDTPQTQLNFSAYQFAKLTVPPEIFSLKIRLAVSGTVGLTGGVLAGIGVKRVVTKIVRSVFFKSSAKTLVGVATKRTSSALGAGIAAGSTGAILGTGVAPGPGTAAGAVIGFGTGVLGALVTDYVLLKLEEVINRDNFRTNLMSMLEIQRKELLASMKAGETVKDNM